MSSQTEVAEKRYIDAITEGMGDAMAADETVVLMGIDVGAGGGIFAATKGLFEQYPERVHDTPISEMGFVGAAVGAAMTGLRPIVEIMFMDFIGVCLDPIMNQAAKLRYMTGGGVTIPVVFRTQTGAGRAAGAQHSQSLESLLAHIPGLKVLTPGTPRDAYDLMRAAVEDPNPVVYVENRRLYGRRGNFDPADSLPLGKARVAREGDDVTVVTWGQTLRDCLAAADIAQVSLEVIDLRSIVPMDIETVFESVAKTGRLLVTHEAVQDFGAGAEIGLRVATEMFDQLLAPVARLGAATSPLPYNPGLESLLLPSSESIMKAAEKLASEG